MSREPPNPFQTNPYPRYPQAPSEPNQEPSNPYSAPGAPSGPAGYAGFTGSPQVSPRAVQLLRETRPWVRFVSVLLMIGACLSLLGSVSCVILGATTDFRYARASAVFYLVFGVLYFAPATFLWQYANRIGDLLFTHSMQALEESLRAQRSFWVYGGAIAVLMMVGLVLIILVATSFAP